jgi:hypothetical protein
MSFRCGPKEHGGFSFSDAMSILQKCFRDPDGWDLTKATNRFDTLCFTANHLVLTGYVNVVVSRGLLSKGYEDCFSGHIDGIDKHLFKRAEDLLQLRTSKPRKDDYLKPLTPAFKTALFRFLFEAYSAEPTRILNNYMGATTADVFDKTAAEIKALASTDDFSPEAFLVQEIAHGLEATRSKFTLDAAVDWKQIHRDFTSLKAQKTLDHLERHHTWSFVYANDTTSALSAVQPCRLDAKAARVIFDDMLEIEQGSVEWDTHVDTWSAYDVGAFKDKHSCAGSGRKITGLNGKIHHQMHGPKITPPPGVDHFFEVSGRVFSDSKDPYRTKYWDFLKRFPVKKAKSSKVREAIAAKMGLSGTFKSLADAKVKAATKARRLANKKKKAGAGGAGSSPKKKRKLGDDDDDAAAATAAFFAILKAKKPAKKPETRRPPSGFDVPGVGQFKTDRKSVFLAQIRSGSKPPVFRANATDTSTGEVRPFMFKFFTKRPEADLQMEVNTVKGKRGFPSPSISVLMRCVDPTTGKKHLVMVTDDISGEGTDLKDSGVTDGGLRVAERTNLSKLSKLTKTKWKTDPIPDDVLDQIIKTFKLRKELNLSDSNFSNVLYRHSDSKVISLDEGFHKKGAWKHPLFTTKPAAHILSQVEARMLAVAEAAIVEVIDESDDEKEDEDEDEHEGTKARTRKRKRSTSDDDEDEEENNDDDDDDASIYLKF